MKQRTDSRRLGNRNLWECPGDMGVKEGAQLGRGTVCSDHKAES